MGADEQVASLVTANPIMKGEDEASLRLVVKVLEGGS